MRRATVVLACVALAGCMANADGTNLLAPAAPAVWRTQTTTPAAPVRADWLAGFGSRELAALGEQALGQNFDVAAAAARLAQAQALTEVAASALWPQISGSADGRRSRTPGTLRSNDPPFEASIGQRFGLGLSASWLLDIWGRNRATAEAAANDAIAAGYELQAVSVATLAALANAYLQLAVAQDRLALARENVAIAQRVLGAIRARLDVGAANALDVAQQESVLANLRATAPGLEQQAEQARNLVALLAGRPPQTTRVQGARLRSLKLPTVRPGLPAQILARRPDVAAAEARLAAASADVVAARAALLPSITLTSDAGLDSLSLRNLLRPEALALSIAAGLAQPIFDGGALQARLRAQTARQRELLAAYSKSIVAALTDVENALVAVRKTAEQDRLRALAVAAARRAYDITEERLREGTIDVVTLLNTQQTLFQAQDAAALARYQRLLALVSLYQALGGGFTRAEAGAVVATGERRAP